MNNENAKIAALEGLQLHEQMDLDYQGTSVMRVPGGFIYTFRYIREAGVAITSQFVKFGSATKIETEILSRLK